MHAIQNSLLKSYHMCYGQDKFRPVLTDHLAKKRKCLTTVGMFEQVVLITGLTVMSKGFLRHGPPVVRYSSKTSHTSQTPLFFVSSS